MKRTPRDYFWLVLAVLIGSLFIEQGCVQPSAVAPGAVNARIVDQGTANDLLDRLEGWGTRLWTKMQDESDSRAKQLKPVAETTSEGFWTALFIGGGVIIGQIGTLLKAWQAAHHAERAANGRTHG